MRNQRPSYDEDRNFGSRNRGQERGGYRSDDMQSRGRGEDGWQQQHDESGRFGGEESSPWRGGQYGQRDPGEQGGHSMGERGNYGSSSGMARSGFGGHDQHDRMFDQADRRSSEHDGDFHNFRNEHMSKLEGDYQKWRNELRKKFTEEFEKWRSERNAKHSSQGGTEGAQGQKKST